MRIGFRGQHSTDCRQTRPNTQRTRRVSQRTPGRSLATAQRTQRKTNLGFSDSVTPVYLFKTLRSLRRCERPFLAFVAPLREILRRCERRVLRSSGLFPRLTGISSSGRVGVVCCPYAKSTPVPDGATGRPTAIGATPPFVSRRYGGTSDLPWRSGRRSDFRYLDCRNHFLSGAGESND